MAVQLFSGYLRSSLKMSAEWDNLRKKNDERCLTKLLEVFGTTVDHLFSLSFPTRISFFSPPTADLGLPKMERALQVERGFFAFVVKDAVYKLIEP
jgi:hypothetical protein